MQRHEDGSVALSRKELSEQMWATSMRQLAKEYIHWSPPQGRRASVAPWHVRADDCAYEGDPS